MQKKNKRQSKYFAPQNQQGEQHKCDHVGCNKAGEYRAPKNARLKEYYWFCLEHVQEYNSHWNYYENENINADEFAYDKHRRFKFSSHIKYNFGLNFDDGYDFFAQSAAYQVSENIHLSAQERQALEIMQLDYDDLNIETLKNAYKKAVKKYHPDLNRNSAKDAEEIFKLISTSYKSMLTKLNLKN